MTAKGYTSREVCAGCHADIHTTWKNSLHAMSSSDPIFDAAYWEAIKLSRGAARPLCLSCHAHTTRLTKDYDQRLRITEEGVTCDFCHTITAARPLYPISGGSGRDGGEADPTSAAGSPRPRHRCKPPMASLCRT